jgi:hypothetical protein
MNPGVFYSQKDLSQTVSGIESCVMAIAGNAKWGPSDALTQLDGLQKYVQLHGKPVDPETTPVFYQLALWFKLGKTCYFVRPQGASKFGGAEALKGGLAIGIAAGLSDLPTVPSGENVVGIYTKYAGEHDLGSVNIAFFDVDNTTGTFGIQVGVVVTEAGDALDTGNVWFEEHRVSVIKGAKDGFGRSMYLPDVLKRDSQLIYGTVKAGAKVDDVPVSYISPATKATLVTLAHNSYTEATEGEIMLAYEKFYSLDAVTIDLVIPGSFTMDVLNKCADVATVRGDCFYIVTPAVSETWTKEGISTTWLSTVTKQWFGAAYGMYYTIKDEYNDTDVVVPAAGLIAGAYSYSDAISAKWYAPAGARRGVQPGIELGVNWTAAETSDMYELNLNWVAKTPRYGITLEGQRTLYGVKSALRHVNVSRMMLQVKRDLTAFLQDFLYEFNNSRNRSLAFDGVSNYLQDIKTREGLYDYKVVCDDTNNTPSVIDQSKMIMDIYVKPTIASEFIYLRSTIASTGVDFSKLVATA